MHSLTHTCTHTHTHSHSLPSPLVPSGLALSLSLSLSLSIEMSPSLSLSLSPSLFVKLKSPLSKYFLGACVAAQCYAKPGCPLWSHELQTPLFPHCFCSSPSGKKRPIGKRRSKATNNEAQNAHLLTS